MWIYHNLFIHLPVDGHLGYFQFGAIMNNVTMNIHVKFLFEHMYSILLCIYLGMGLQGHIVILGLIY